MGKMIDAQSIVVASTATDGPDTRARSLRFVFFHSVALAALVGVVVTFWKLTFHPFTKLVIPSGTAKQASPPAEPVAAPWDHRHEFLSPERRIAFRSRRDRRRSIPWCTAFPVLMRRIMAL